MGTQSNASAIETNDSASGSARANDEPEALESARDQEGDTAVFLSEAYDDEIKEVPAAADVQDPLAVVIEAAVNPEFEILGELGKEGAKAAEMPAGRLIWKWREFANETAAYTKEVLDYSYAFGAELLRAESPAAAAEAQIQFGRSTYLRLVDLILKVSGVYLNTLRQACDAAQTAEAKAKG